MNEGTSNPPNNGTQEPPPADKVKSKRSSLRPTSLFLDRYGIYATIETFLRHTPLKDSSTIVFPYKMTSGTDAYEDATNE